MEVVGAHGVHGDDLPCKKMGKHHLQKKQMLKLSGCIPGTFHFLDFTYHRVIPHRRIPADFFTQIHMSSGIGVSKVTPLSQV